MIDFVLWALAAIGATDIVVSSVIARPLRDFLKQRSSFFGEMLQCHQCTGFWCGIICGIILGLSYIPVLGPIIYLLLLGFASSFLAPLGKSTLEALFGTLTLPDDFGPITQDKIQALNEDANAEIKTS